MVADRFQHLHVHSHYSLLDGVCTIPQLVDAAAFSLWRPSAAYDSGRVLGAREVGARATLRSDGSAGAIVSGRWRCRLGAAVIPP